jgi:hypothetical protein
MGLCQDQSRLINDLPAGRPVAKDRLDGALCRPARATVGRRGARSGGRVGDDGAERSRHRQEDAADDRGGEPVVAPRNCTSALSLVREFSMTVPKASAARISGMTMKYEQYHKNDQKVPMAHHLPPLPCFPITCCTPVWSTVGTVRITRRAVERIAPFPERGDKRHCRLSATRSVHRHRHVRQFEKRFVKKPLTLCPNPTALARAFPQAVFAGGSAA